MVDFLLALVLANHRVDVPKRFEQQHSPNVLCLFLCAAGIHVCHSDVGLMV